MAGQDSGGLAEDPVAELRRLHRAVDIMAKAVADQHGDRLRCHRGCAGCCADRLTVFEVEAERIRQDAPIWTQGQEAGPVGACAFLDVDGGCRIYAARPYVCRTQGLPLRWIELEAAGTLSEFRDICPLNAEGPGLDTLQEEACWALGPVEQRLAALQGRFGEPTARVPLRGLFGEES